jgi:uncharacterized protein YeaO (DUF488 family)
MRILVDHIWPRGLSKTAAALDLWIKEVAPSSQLRKWFDHRPERWLEFKRRYDAELDNNQTAVAQFTTLPGRGPITLVYAARDIEHNNAEALRQYLAGEKQKTRRR